MSGKGDLKAAEIARQELRQFLSLAEQTGIDGDRQRRALRLSQDDWRQLLGILHDAPLPSKPALPVLLRHLGYLASRMDRATQAQYTQAQYPQAQYT